MNNSLSPDPLPLLPEGEPVWSAELPTPESRRLSARERRESPALPQAQPAPQLEEAASLPSAEISRWQDIIWQEWRHTRDEEYARRLFELVGNEPVGKEAERISLLLGGLYGGLAGLLLSILYPLSFWPLGLIGGGLLGGIASLAGWSIKRHPTWREWLGKVTFNLTPNELGLISGGLALGLLGVLLGWLLGPLGGLGYLVGFFALGLLLIVSLPAGLISWLLSFSRQPDPLHLHHYRAFWFWWRQRPRRDQLEAALQQAAETSLEARQLWGQVRQQLTQQRQQPDSLDKLISRLRSPNWLERFMARHFLATAGGEAVPHLQPLASQISSALRPIALDLLSQISQETTARLASRENEFLCPHCLTACGPHDISFPKGDKLRYYGCRTCGQSQELLEGQVVAVLDQEMATEIEVAGTIRVNWLARRNLFDFNTVEIIKATDEEVERFVVQIGNDTDAVRAGRYTQLPCLVYPGCVLSENSLKLLRRPFGRVEVSE
jgi:hypothetical protein